jgi:hypothetical protein
MAIVAVLGHDLVDYQVTSLSGLVLIAGCGRAGLSILGTIPITPITIPYEGFSVLPVHFVDQVVFLKQADTIVRSQFEQHIGRAVLRRLIRGKHHVKFSRRQDYTG